MGVHLDNLPRTIYVEREGNKPLVVMIDQRALPGELLWLRTDDWRAVVDAVKTLAVRGAPAIGIAGAAAVMLAAFSLAGECASAALFAARLRKVAAQIAEARPTAVNLAWGVRRATQTAARALEAGKSTHECAEALYGLTEALIAEDEAANRAIGAHGAALLRARAAAACRPLGLLTHCNAGSLATAFYGTALGVVYAAAEEGLVARVYADETRPMGQGARLTVWELAQAGVPTTLICDNMAATMMAAGLIDAVVVGADRIAANGDAANKIGTLGVAVLARHFGIPFYVAAPVSTVDLDTPDGTAIPIEERDASEVLPAPLPGVSVRNPAFDVTPAELITAVVTEHGAVSPADIGSFAKE